MEHISNGNPDPIDAKSAKGPVFSAVQNVVVGPFLLFAALHQFDRCWG